MTTKHPFISIIIPHYNDPERLTHCIELLEKQTYPTDQYEIIIVDNGSSVSPESALVESPHSRLFVETKPGSYAARNRGLLEAQGEYVAFTDADCISQLDWLEKGTDALLKNPDIGFVAGQVDVFAANPASPTVAEIHEQLSSFPIENYVRFWHFGVTANLFTRMDVIKKVGNFDDSLKSGGDLQWCQRVHAAGYDVLFDPDVVINHPALQSSSAIYSKKRRVLGGYHDLFIRDHQPHEYLWLEFPKDMIPPVRRSRELLAMSQYPLSTRLKLVWIEWGCNYAGTSERVRLLWGGQSNRS